MLELLGGLIEDIVDFLLVLFLVRTVRRRRNRPERPIGGDAKQLAILEWLLLPLAAFITVLCSLSMYLAGFGSFRCVTLPSTGLVLYLLFQCYRQLDI